MDTSTMYYTFSTIAQVLAAFLALSGVFMVFKLQEIRQRIMGNVHNFINQIDRIPKDLLPKDEPFNCKAVSINLVSLHRSQNISGMKEEMDKMLLIQTIKDHPIFQDVQNIPNIVSSLISRRRKIILSTFISLGIGIFALLFSIFILIKVPLLVDYVDRLFAIVITCTIVSILAMFVTIYLSISES